MKLSLRGPAALLALGAALTSAGVARGAAPVRAPALFQSAREPAFEQQIAAELQARTPEAVPLFADATAAYDANDAARASELFGKVHELAPWFDHATRRRCAAESMLDHHARALELCSEALAARDSAENEVAMAAVLSASRDGAAASEADLTLARSHAERAATLDPTSVYAQLTRCHIAVSQNDATTLRSCANGLDRLAPDAPATTLFDVILQLQQGAPEEARKVIARARTRGLSADEGAALEGMIEGQRPVAVRALSIFGRIVGAWALVFVMMLAAGYALSRVTLRMLARAPAETTAHPKGPEAWLRKTYRAVLWACSAYYYVSMPLLAVAVIGATAGVIYGIWAAGWIAPKLFILLPVAAFGSLRAIARSLFTRRHDEDPGPRLDLAAQPRVRALLDEVAARVGTRPVDTVFMTPFTEVAVFDRGGVVRALRGTRERCLILGAGVLDGMGVRALKSVLAHEYGHFRNDDTAGGGFALSVRRSLNAMARHLVEARAATMTNPAWWFVRGFGRAFLGISQGASRLQEVLADRWAAFAYGSLDFERGLVHVIERSTRFDAHLDATLGEVVPAKRALVNLYAYVPETPADESALRSKIDGVLSREPSRYDSHPCPRDRLALVRALAQPGGAASDDDAMEAWSLFDARAVLECSLTATVRERVRAVHGVTLPATEPAR